MWKVFLGVLFHRGILFFIALLAINSHISSLQPGKTLRPIKPFNELLTHFVQRVSENPEARALDQFRARPLEDIFKESTGPFLWVNRLFVAIVPFPSGVSVIFWSNLFLFLFLWQLFAVVERLAISEVGTGAAILTAFWITSYELSLGASLSFSCFALMVVIRSALDNLWVFSGMGTAFFLLGEPVGAALFPLLLMVFLYHQRHSPMKELFKNLFFLAVPVGIAVYVRMEAVLNLQALVQSSALFNVVQMFQSNSQISWALSQSVLGQTVSVAFFLVGAVCALIVNTSILYRLIPLYVLLIVLGSSSYATIASRLSLAGVCLGGISAVSSPLVTRLLQIVLLALGGAEVFAIFS